MEGDGPAQSLQPQPSLSKKWKETGQLSPYSPSRASPRSGRRRASSVPTGGTEPLQEVEEEDGPAQSLQAEPSLSKKWKETGQFSPCRRNRASPRSGRRRASSVPTAPTEPLQEVEGDPYISRGLSKPLVVLSNFSYFLDIFIECAFSERMQCYYLLLGIEYTNYDRILGLVYLKYYVALLCS